MIKITVEINEIEHKTVEKISEQYWFSEKINAIDKPLPN